MANGSTVTKEGKKIVLYRAYTVNGSLSATQYLPPSKARIGINGDTPTQLDTDVDNVIPVSDGTVCDNGDNTLTGSSGGDNTTDNSTTYKEGAGTTDNKSQNLIANGTNVLKIWTIANLASLGTNVDPAKPIALWLYIDDATALAKFKSSGTCLEIKFGSDSSNYYSITRTAAQLSVGWNWISTNTTLVSALTATGSPGSPLDTFIIEITTNNATDTFATGDVIYDLLRQWTTADTLIDIEPAYPSIDLSALEATMRFVVEPTDANGFDIDSLVTRNTDTSPLTPDSHVYTDASKSSSERFIYEVKNRIP